MSDNLGSFIRPDSFWRQLGLRANQTVVHLGCGAGFYLIPAATIVGSKGLVYGVDVLADMLAEAESRAQRAGVATTVRTVLANLENSHGSSLADNIADWTLVANILYQSDPPFILAEAKRVTKPGSHIIIVEWDIIATPLGPPNADRVPKPDVLNIIDKLKLTIAKEFSPSPYHYGLLVKV